MPLLVLYSLLNALTLSLKILLSLEDCSGKPSCLRSTLIFGMLEANPFVLGEDIVWGDVGCAKGKVEEKEREETRDRVVHKDVLTTKRWAPNLL